MKTRQIHGLGLGEFLIFAPAKEMLKSAYFFSALPQGAAFLCLFRRLHSHSAAGITFLFRNNFLPYNFS